MNHRFVLQSFMALVVALPLSVSAVPLQVGIDAFGPGATTFSFGSTGSPSIPGITFSSGFPGTGWGAIATPAYNSLAFATLTISFDTPVQQVGFFFGGNTVNSTPLDIGLGAATTGGFTLETFGTGAMPADGVNNWIFYGFRDLGGIDSLTFHTETNNGWIVGIGELVTGGVIAAVPEPPTFALLSLALLGLGWLAPRRSAPDLRRARGV